MPVSTPRAPGAPVLLATLGLLSLDAIAAEDRSEVLVSARRMQDQYRVDSTDSIGPLGSTSILDAPFSISVLPEELLRNSQAINFKEASKYLPLVSYQEQQGPDILRPQTRGLQGGNFQNSRIDGMTAFATVAAAMEQFSRIEVVNGPSASLYGPANPSGMFNFTTKRPTDDSRLEVGLGYASDQILTARLDAGGPVIGDRVGVRVNAVYGEGDGYVSGSHQRRLLGDVGVDVHPWDGGTLELNFSRYHLENEGYPGWFTYGGAIVLPSAPDPDRVGYGQSYAGVEMRTELGVARYLQQLNEQWRFVVGVLHQDAFRDINTPVNNLTNNAGAYTSSFANGFAPRFVMLSDAAYVNGSFDTLGIAHDLVVGTAGYKSETHSVITPASAASVRLGAASIAAPVVFARPANGPPNVRAIYNSSNTYQQGVNLNDTLRLDDAWSVRVGGSYDRFHVDNFNPQRVALAGYRNDGLSGSASLAYKPAVNQTAYVTWSSSLQAGDLAPGTAANAGVSLEPYRSRQIEAGYKIRLENIDLSTALFRIERPFANIDPASRVFRLSGEQVNEGLEVSATGELLTGLRLYGGFTWLSARLDGTALPSTDGKRFVGAPRFKGNVLLEYAIPGLAALVATADFQFATSRAGNDTNTLTVAGYQTLDLGGRYVADVAGRTVTMRLAVNNALDRAYWSTIAPSNITGTNAGNMVAHLGAPRTWVGSVAVEF